MFSRPSVQGLTFSSLFVGAVLLLSAGAEAATDIKAGISVSAFVVSNCTVGTRTATASPISARDAVNVSCTQATPFQVTTTPAVAVASGGTATLVTLTY